MGLTFKKRDDLDKILDELGVSTVDIVVDGDKTDKNDANAKKVDPFAKFLAPKDDTKATDSKNN